jgi:peroxiredoxin
MAVGLVVAATLVVVLSQRLTRLTHAYQVLQRRASTLTTGEVVPTFQAVTLTGDTLTVGERLDGGKQVLLLLTTTCPFCRATLPVWAQLADSIRQVRPDVEVIAVSLDSLDATRRYAEEQGLAMPVVTVPTRKLVRLLRAGRVPQTVVVDHEGRVLYGWTGLLSADAVLDSILIAVTAAPSAVPVDSASGS